MTDLINKLNAAYRLAEWYREGTAPWLVILESMSNHGFYGINRSGREVTAYYNGVRFSL